MKTMLLITSTWGENKTFKLIPVSDECPFNEAIYDPTAKVLAIVGKTRKESFHMLPKLNEFGDIQTLKIGRRANGKDYAEERKTVETFYEYYIEDTKEIEEFLTEFATNASTYDYKKYMNATAPSVAPTSTIVTI